MMGADQSHQQTKPDQHKRQEAADRESSASTPDAPRPGKNERCDWSEVKTRVMNFITHRQIRRAAPVPHGKQERGQHVLHDHLHKLVLNWSQFTNDCGPDGAFMVPWKT